MIRVLRRLLKFLPVASVVVVLPVCVIYLIVFIDYYPADSESKKEIIRHCDNPERFRKEIVLKKEIDAKKMVFTSSSEYIVQVEFDKIYEKIFLDFMYKLAVDFHRHEDKDFIIDFHDVSELFSDYILKNDSYIVRKGIGAPLNHVNIELCKEELEKNHYPSTRYHIEMYDTDGVLILKYNSTSSSWQNLESL